MFAIFSKTFLLFAIAAVDVEGQLNILVQIWDSINSLPSEPSSYAPTLGTLTHLTLLEMKIMNVEWVLPQKIHKSNPNLTANIKPIAL